MAWPRVNERGKSRNHERQVVWLWAGLGCRVNVEMVKGELVKIFNLGLLGLSRTGPRPPLALHWSVYFLPVALRAMHFLDNKGLLRVAQFVILFEVFVRCPR